MTTKWNEWLDDPLSSIWGGIKNTGTIFTPSYYKEFYKHQVKYWNASSEEKGHSDAAGFSTLLTGLAASGPVVEFTGTSVIGPRAIYRQFAKEIGANFLDLTDQEWSRSKNLKFLKGVVKRGDQVIFAGKFNRKLLDPKSTLAREIRYLTSHGYYWTEDFSKLLPK